MSRNWVSRFLTALVLSFAAAAPALAASGDGAAKVGAETEERGRSAGLAKLDADGDRAVSIEEFLKRRLTRFQRQDKNSDGALDADELATSRLTSAARRDQRMMARLDRDADGFVTRVEYDAGPTKSGEKSASQAGGLDRYRFRRQASPQRRAALFLHLDRNADGKIEAAELESARKDDAEYQRRKALHLYDRDRDGKVTLDEFTADQRARFSRMDLDGDGRITAPDLPPLQRASWVQR